MANPTKSQGYSLVTTIFAVTAFVLMWTASIRCNFIKFTDTMGTSEPISLKLGIWYYQFWSLVFSTSGTYVFESCHGYPDAVDIDASWKAARAFSVIAFILAIVMLVAACIAACANNPDYTVTHAWEAPAYAFLAISQGLTLLLLGSNACSSSVLTSLGNPLGGLTFSETCSMDTGAKLSISSTAIWAAAAVSSFMAHRAEKQEVAEGGDASLREPLNA